MTKTHHAGRFFQFCENLLVIQRRCFTLFLNELLQRLDQFLFAFSCRQRHAGRQNTDIDLAAQWIDGGLLQGLPV